MTTPATTPRMSAKLVRLADVQPEPVTWLWPGRVPRGKLTLLIGDPGLGKSNVTLDMAARVSTAKGWPDGALVVEPGDVVILSAEDGIADTIRPRVDALGGDASRLWILQMVQDPAGERLFNLVTDLSLVRVAFDKTRAVLLIVDPVSAYLGTRINSYKDTEVRAVLAPVAALAEEIGAAVVGVMHLNKDQQKAAIYRTGGSIGFVGAARSVLAVAKDPDDADHRLLTPVKCNLAASPPTLGFRLPDGVVTWDPDPVDADVESLLDNRPVEFAELTVAKQFLGTLLQKAPVLTRDVERAATAQGITRRTLQRAKKALHVESKRIDGIAGDGAWIWVLPG